MDTHAHQIEPLLPADARMEPLLACAHQRHDWGHPFVDGNGRVMRLHTHTWFTAQGYTGCSRSSSTR